SKATSLAIHKTGLLTDSGWDSSQPGQRDHSGCGAVGCRSDPYTTALVCQPVSGYGYPLHQLDVVSTSGRFCRPNSTVDLPILRGDTPFGDRMGRSGGFPFSSGPNSPPGFPGLHPWRYGGWSSRHTCSFSSCLYSLRSSGRTSSFGRLSEYGSSYRAGDGSTASHIHHRNGRLLPSGSPDVARHISQ